MSDNKVPNIGGVYTDPFHAPTSASANLYELKSPWFGGLRILGRSSSATTKFTCIGCDDGIHWWTLTGEFTDISTTPAKINMDFTPKAPGVGLLQCGFEKGSLYFYEEDGSTIGNTWSRLEATSDFSLETQTKHAAFNDVNGLYVDEELYKPGSFAGIRVVSDRKGKFLTDEICVIGTDDGVEWWAMTGGAFTNRRQGEFTIGGGGENGKIRSGGKLETTLNGKAVTWTKMATNMDLHALPKL